MFRVLPLSFLVLLLTVGGCGRSSFPFVNNNNTNDHPVDCGNGAIDPGEECDGANLGGETCESISMGIGVLSCSAQCTFDIAGCSDYVPFCGNFVQEGAEDCDAQDLQGQSCASLGFEAGTLGCTPGCRFDISQCEGEQPVCGNGVVEAAELCDGPNLDGESCESLGFFGGELSCDEWCELDVSACEVSVCGNGQREPGEQCDADDLGGESCQTLGYDGGTLLCDATCELDDSGCWNIVCGDGVINPGEECDGANLNGQSCQSLGYTGGTLGCAVDCTFDVGACWVVVCGDGVVGPGEECDGPNLSGQSCQSLGYDGGTLGCSPGCTFDTGACTTAASCSPTGGGLGCGSASSGNTATSPNAVDVVDEWTGTGCHGWPMTGPEIVYEYTVGASDEGVQVTLTGLTVDLDLIVLQDTGAGCSPALACVDWSYNGGSQDELVTFNAQANTTYYIVVDGYNSAQGPFALSFQCTAAEICNDGLDNDGDGDTDCDDPDCNGDPACWTHQIFEVFPVNTPSHEWDLDQTTIFFIPDHNEPNGYSWSVTDGVGSYPSPPGTGTSSTTVVTFGSASDSVTYTLPGAHTFTFFDVTYTEFTLNSHGNITFGGGDTDSQESATAFTNGLPRIAGHWDTLDPTNHGTVTVDVFSNRVAITYDQVDDPFAGGNVSFQIELYWMGAIAITNLTHGGVDGLVGITEGGGGTGAPEVDFYQQIVIPGFYELFTSGGGDSFDLQGQTVLFTPAPATPEGYTYQVGPAASWPFQPGTGNLSSTPIEGLFPNGDSSQEVLLTSPNTVTFYGQTYDRIYVGANGYLTFGAGDTSWTPSAQDHFDLPRLSGQFYDWEPDDGGTVTVDEFLMAGGYAVAVTFEDVPHYNNPHPTISFQMAIFSNGTVQFYYDDVTTNGGLVGISAGTAGAYPLETNFLP